jgi:hypothetical protein
LAQMRSADRVRKYLLFGVDRTYRGYHEADAFDPKQTWGNGLLDHVVGPGEGSTGEGRFGRRTP